jgi:hypothetical protein
MIRVLVQIFICTQPGVTTSCQSSVYSSTAGLLGYLVKWKFVSLCYCFVCEKLFEVFVLYLSGDILCVTPANAYHGFMHFFRVYILW